MNKDALLATLIGFGIGLIITGLILIGPGAWKAIPKPTINFSQWFSVKNLPKTDTGKDQPKEFFVTVNSPIADSIESESELLVSGTTSAQTLVVIQGNSNEDVALAKDDGLFAGKIRLIEGQNDITVTGYLNEKSIQKTVTVFYTPDAL